MNPSRFRRAAGTRTDAIAENVDFAPWLLDYAGVAAPARIFPARRPPKGGWRHTGSRIFFQPN